MENILSDDVPVGVYRTHDKIKNFKIRVKLRKISNACFTEKDTSSFGDSNELELVNMMKAPTASAERVFSWQEKVEKTEMADDASRKVADQSKKDNITICLFSFNDAYISSTTWKNNKSVTSPASQMSCLEEQICKGNPKSRHYFTDIGTWQKPFFSTYKRIVKESTNTKVTALPVGQSMAVMAALFFGDSSVSEEIELCFLQVDDHGTLTIVPDFSKRKSYTFVNSRSETFEYEIENASKMPQSHTVQREKYLMKKIALYKSRLKEGIIGHEINKPSPGTAFFSLKCEIVSGSDFSLDTFIHFLVTAPNGWNTEDSLEGYTGTCRCKLKDNTSVSYYGHIFSIDFTTNLEKYNDEPLKVIFEITSVDCWGNFRNKGYGYNNIVLSPGTQVSDVYTWKIEPTTLRHKLQNFFIGGMPHLEDLSYIINPKETKDKQLSKYGLQTTSSGKVTFRTYLLQQTN